MIIRRWQAPHRPDAKYLKLMLELEGLNFTEETLGSEQKVGEHRHPFTEVRFVLEGEMIFVVAGNQLVVRVGDRIEIPSNTRHSHGAFGPHGCTSIFGQKIS